MKLSKKQKQFILEFIEVYVNKGFQKGSIQDFRNTIERNEKINPPVYLGVSQLGTWFCWPENKLMLLMWHMKHGMTKLSYMYFSNELQMMVSEIELIATSTNQYHNEMRDLYGDTDIQLQAVEEDIRETFENT